MLNHIQSDIRILKDNDRAANLSRFFKTKPGEYGAGDIFLGLTVPQTRSIITKHQKDATFSDAKVLLESIYHEERLAGVLLLVHFAKKSKYPISEIANFYLNHVDRINNWDLVDLSSGHIIGPYLQSLDKVSQRRLIAKCITSPNLWLNRIIVLASSYNIGLKDPSLTLYLAEKFLNHPHDLMHKAVGWMLREVGKRVSQKDLTDFLDKFATIMPRIMLRYSIERLPTIKRTYYLHLK